MSRILSLRERPLDIAFILFFVINIGFVTYIVDLEQLVIADPLRFEYPLWPPRALVDLVHWWGRNFDPPLMAREPWWKATIWLDVLGFGPFYAFAIFAFVRGRAWIRLPSVVWASVMMTNVIIILSEELWGVHRTPAPALMVAVNAPWLLWPLAMFVRMRRADPFSGETK